MFGNLADIIGESSIALKWRQKDRKKGKSDEEKER